MGGKLLSRRMVFTSQLVYLFLQAAIDVLFKVVWVTAARRPGFRDLAKATITSTRRWRKAESGRLCFEFNCTAVNCQQGRLWSN